MKDFAPERINIGSGSSGIRGYANIDSGLKFKLYKFRSAIEAAHRLGLIDSASLAMIRVAGKPPPNYIRHDIRKGLPFRTDSVQFSYCSHVLEHLHKYQGVLLLNEVYRVLRPGGIARFVTEDVQLICERYRKGLMDADQFNHIVRTDVRRARPGLRSRLFDWASESSTMGHVYIYDYSELSKTLLAAGFRNISRSQLRSGAFPDLAELEKDFESMRREASMYVEAIK